MEIEDEVEQMTNKFQNRKNQLHRPLSYQLDAAQIPHLVSDVFAGRRREYEGVGSQA
jgi:hypothetical protein